MSSRSVPFAPTFLGALCMVLTAGCYTVVAERPSAIPPAADRTGTDEGYHSFADAPDDSIGGPFRADTLLDQEELDGEWVDDEGVAIDEENPPLELPDSHARPIQIGEDALLLGGITCRFVIHTPVVREGDRVQAWFQFENPWSDPGRVDLSDEAMAAYVIRDVRGHSAVGHPIWRRIRPPGRVDWGVYREREFWNDPYDSGVPHRGQVSIPPRGDFFAPVPIAMRDYSGDDLPPGRYQIEVRLLSREEPRYKFEITVR